MMPFSRRTDVAEEKEIIEVDLVAISILRMYLTLPYRIAWFKYKLAISVISLFVIISL